MASKRKKREAFVCEIQMTSMIDVVFQLLIYFIVTLKPLDVTAHLDVFRPAASRPTEANAEPPKMIQIEILPGVYTMNGRSVDLESLTRLLGKLGEISTTQTVMIMCAAASDHEQLVNVLDRCARAQLTNLSVVSMD